MGQFYTVGGGGAGSTGGNQADDGASRGLWLWRWRRRHWRDAAGGAGGVPGGGGGGGGSGDSSTNNGAGGNGARGEVRNMGLVVANSVGLSGLVAPKTNVQIFTSTGTWTKPAGCTRVYMEVIGGGGSGGGC